MACNVIYNSKGEVEKVLTDQGTTSQLYLDAKKEFGDKKALEVFHVSQSDGFRDTIPPAEKFSPKTIAEKYTRIITQVKESNPDQYWSVDIPSPEEVRTAAEEGRIVDVKGGMGIVTPDGNMVGLFKYDQSQKGTAAAVQEARIKKGGLKLDNFDGYLTRTYQKNGFRVAARISFNEEYADELKGWEKEKHGTPDVVFMVYDPSGKLNIKEKTFEDYDEAKAYRDSFVEEAKVGHPAYSVNRATSSNYANLTEDGQGNFIFYHRGGKGYETVKRTSGSTSATSRDEASALGKVGGVAMYYTAPEDAESMVTGASRYMVKVPTESVYDFNTDPLNLIEEAKALHTKEHPGRAFDANTQLAYVTKLAGEKGYQMVVSEWDGKTRAQTTTEFAPSDVEEKEGSVIVKPFKENYSSNRESGYISSIPKTKADKLEELYRDVNTERNRQNKYDSLYHLAASPSKPSQEGITGMIMNSDISSEIKDRYQNILNTPSQKRESFKVQEPSLESVMQYITSQNESKEPMNYEQTRDFKNAQLASGDFNYSKLKEVFYDENGIFFVSPSKLVASGLYSQYEAEHLSKDLELQDTVKKSIEALKNTEDVQSVSQDFTQLEKENVLTQFGKLNNLNPYIVEKQIQNALAATTREEFDEAIGELPFVEFQKSMESSTTKEEVNKLPKHYSFKKDNKGRTFLLYEGKEVGRIEELDKTTDTKGKKWVSIDIEINEKHRGKGLSIHMYNEMLKTLNERGIEGIISTDLLLQSPTQTNSTRKHLNVEISTDKNLLEKINSGIDEINKSTEEDNARYGEEEPLVETAQSVTLIRKKESSISNKDKLFAEMQKYKKAEMMLEVNGEIKPSLNANTEVTVPQVAKSLKDKKVLSDIVYFVHQDLSILNSRPDSTKVLLQNIEKGLINEGYDVIGL